jgi:hypothetical protein
LEWGDHLIGGISGDQAKLRRCGNGWALTDRRKEDRHEYCGDHRSNAD